MAFAPRQPRVRSTPYLGFIRELPCISCAVAGSTVFGVEAAHVRYSFGHWRAVGMQEKPSDDRTVPLCASCHRTGPDAQHKSHERPWWARLGIDPVALCEALSAAYPSASTGAALVQQFAAEARRLRPVAQRTGGLSAPVSAAPKPVTVAAHMTERRDERGNIEIILQSAGQGRDLVAQRVFVCPDALQGAQRG